MSAKSILILFFLLPSVILLAQEKYEFCIIEYYPKKKLLSISKNGTEHSDELITNSNDSTNKFWCKYNANPLLEKVKLFQEKDWEVMSFNTNLSRRHKKRVYSAYLRRKMK